MVHTRDELGRALRGGLVAGTVGGVVLALHLVASALAAGADPWTRLKGAAAPFLGERALDPGFDGVAVAVGVLAHLGVSLGWGLLFGFLFVGLSRAATVLAGLGWGVIAWVGMYYVVLPILGLQRIAAGTPIEIAVLSHLIFGLAVGIGFVPFQIGLPGTLARRWRTRAGRI